MAAEYEYTGVTPDTRLMPSPALCNIVKHPCSIELSIYASDCMHVFLLTIQTSYLGLHLHLTSNSVSVFKTDRTCILTLFVLWLLHSATQKHSSGVFLYFTLRLDQSTNRCLAHFRSRGLNQSTYPWTLLSLKEFYRYLYCYLELRNSSSTYFQSLVYLLPRR